MINTNIDLEETTGLLAIDVFLEHLRQGKAADKHALALLHATCEELRCTPDQLTLSFKLNRLDPGQLDLQVSFVKRSNS